MCTYFRAFRLFCTHFNFPFYPVTKATYLAYLAFLSQSLKSFTLVKNYLSTLSHINKSLGYSCAFLADYDSCLENQAVRRLLGHFSARKYAMSVRYFSTSYANSTLATFSIPAWLRFFSLPFSLFYEYPIWFPIRSVIFPITIPFFSRALVFIFLLAMLFSWSPELRHYNSISVSLKFRFHLYLHPCFVPFLPCVFTFSGSMQCPICLFLVCTLVISIIHFSPPLYLFPQESSF